MRVYVMGAGVSKTAGYPLGAKLFHEVNSFIESCGHAIDRFDYRRDWPALHKWLKANKNPLIREAYRLKNLEALCTVLDQSSMLLRAAADDIAHARKIGSAKVKNLARQYDKFSSAIQDYQKNRAILLWSLEQYLQFKHGEDYATSNDPRWKHLNSFAGRTCKGDVVITFNYDSTIERVLLRQRKWSPRDGYGFETVLQKSVTGRTTVLLKKSPVLVLHLHGASGWYRRPLVNYDFVPSKGGPLPGDAATPGSLDTEISLDPSFLEQLGIAAVDASLPMPPPDERQVFLHPSFLKDFEPQYGNGPLIDLWRNAAVFLRKADQIFVIGYSLPKADSAALTLLLTNCDRRKVHIINPDPQAHLRLTGLLSATMRDKQSFEEWLGDARG